MKNIFKISIVISMLIILIVTSSQSAFAAGNAKQVRLKVNGVYAIVSMDVAGYNQSGNRTNWPPRGYFYYTYSNTPPYPYICQYSGNANGCPTEMTTTGYWWTGIVTINFTVYPTITLPQVYPFQNGLKKVSCTLPIDGKAWSDTLTLTFDAGSNNSSGPTVTEYYNGTNYVTVTSCKVLN